MAYFLPLWLPAATAAQGIAAGALIFLALALLHESVARRGRLARFNDQLMVLQRAYVDLEDELTWTRREVKALREALEGMALSGRAEAGGALAAEVMNEVRLLKSLVGRLAKAQTKAVAAAPPQVLPQVAAGGGTPINVVSPVRAKRDKAGSGGGSLLDQVREALRDDRIELALQPIVSLPQRKRRFYECFSRLTAADGTKLMPEQYIGLAEESGLITTIDNMLLFRCIQVVRKIQRKNQDIGFFCNLSLRTLCDKEFFGDFVEFLESNAELAPNLVFEFAAGDLPRIGPREDEQLNRLARLGCRFSVDQVQSLDLKPAELARRHIRFIKLEAHHFLDTETDQEQDDLLRFMTGVRRHRLDVIVERIESEDILVELLEHELDYGQGYLFGEPRPARD